MHDVEKTTKQWATEVAQLRQRIAELEAVEAERKQAEEALKESEESFRALAENAADGIAILTSDGTHAYVNRRAAEITGYTVEELLQVGFQNLFPQDELKKLMQIFRKKLGGESDTAKYETVIIRKDGQRVPLEVSSALTTWHGKPADIVFSRDITERKRAEEALQESEKRYRNIFETTPVSIIVLDKDGQMVDINPYHLTQIAKGQTPKGDFIGKNIVTHPTIVKSGLSETYKRVLEGKPFDQKDVYFPLLTTGADGYFNVRGVPLLKDDEVIGAVVIQEDITERKRTEEALRESERIYRTLIETIPHGIQEIDISGMITFGNSGYHRMLGYEEGELIGKPMLSTLPNDSTRKELEDYIERLIKEQPIPSPWTGQILTKDGRVKEIQTVWNYKRDDEGRVTGFISIITDITERKQAEEALRKSEEKYRTVVELSPDGVAIASKGRHVFANQSLAKIFGVSDPDELLGKPVMDYIHPDYREIARERIGEQSKRRIPAPLIEEKMIRADGTVIHAEVAAAPLEYEGEQAILAVIRDVTERKRAEEALRESEERYRTLVDNIELGINLIDSDHTILMVNAQMGERFKKPLGDLIGKKCFREFEKRDAVCPHCPGAQTMATGKPAEVETEGVRDDGSRFDVRLQTFPVFGQVGEVSAFIEIAEDITERKRMGEALQKTNETLQAILEFAPLPIFTLDIEGNVGSIWNTAAEEILGWKKEEVLSKPYPAVPRGKEEEFINNVRLGFKGVRGIEARRQRRDGSLIDYSIYTAPLHDSQGHTTVTVAILLDITEQKKAEEALRESEEKYRSLVESSADSIYLVDRDCTYLFMNKKHRSRFGLKNSQVIGRAYGEFHSPEETEDFTQKVEKVFKTGKSLSYEYRSERDDRYFIRTLSPVKSLEDGKPTAATLISKDITDLKRAEEMLREREAFNFALFHYNPVETIVVDLEGKVTGFNFAKEKSGDRLPHIGDLMYKDYAGKHEIDMRAELMVCIKSGKAKAFPERRYGDRYLAITISPFSQGALIISEDISERKRAAELLQMERDTFFSVLKKAPYGVVLIDKDEKGIFSNVEFTAITGYTLKDVSILKDWFRQAYPDKKYRDVVINTLRRDTEEADSDRLYQNKFQRAFFRTFTVICKDGTVKEIEFRPTVLEDGSTIIMLADITERKRMHDLLEAAATEWRTTFDAIGDAVCLLDQQGRIKRCNNAMLGMLEKPFSEIVDRTCWEVLYGVPKLPKKYPVARMQKTRRRETELFLKDNHWFNVAVDPLLDGEGNVVGAVHIMSDITDRILAEEELQNSREQLRNLSTYLESVREQERTVIAREIHDELAQALTAFKMDLSWLDNRLPQDQKPLSAKTKSMHSLIDTTIKTVKRISAELRPGILDDLGLVAAIEWQAEEFQDRTGIPCHVTSDFVDMVVDHDRSTAIFRIFQETLTNVARHARATRVRVSLKEKKGVLTLSVRDNGIGITEKQIADSKAFGLIGMRERVHPWGGKVSIKGEGGKGTRVNVSVPVGNEKDESKDVKSEGVKTKKLHN